MFFCGFCFGIKLQCNCIDLRLGCLTLILESVSVLVFWPSAYCSQCAWKPCVFRVSVSSSLYMSICPY